MNRGARAATVAGAIALFALSAHAAPAVSADYDPRSWAWNGMAQFVALAEGMGFEVRAVSSLEWAALGRDDILFMVYPKHRVDPKRLSGFIHAGGNAVLADDFGGAADAMAELGVLRARVGVPRATRYYDGIPWAPIATAHGDHELARDVGDVVTNHPKALHRVDNAATVVRFEEGALVVAGERGNGKFVAVADPSIFINRMQQDPFRGNVQLAANILRWLSRGGSARRLVLLHGDSSMFGEPQPFIDDPSGGQVGRAVADVNAWMYERREWLLGPAAARGLPIGLVIALVGLAVAALPIRRGRTIHGLWLRFSRPLRRDDPHAVLRQADDPTTATSSLLVVACVLRDQVEAMLVEALYPTQSDSRIALFYGVPEAELVGLATTLKGAAAGAALANVYPRLRALPSRSQAAAPWSTGTLRWREFETLYADVRELCRTLGHDIGTSHAQSPQPGPAFPR